VRSGSRRSRWKVVAWSLLACLTFIETGTSGAHARASTTATLRLAPSVGPPTTRLTVRGIGFDPNEIVDVSFDGGLLRQVRTDERGRFGTKARTPASALPGHHTVTAVGESSGSSALATFTVRTDWTKFHFDSSSTGLNPFENLLSPSNVGALTPKWLANVGKVTSSPAVSRGIAYIGVNGSGPIDANLVALDTSTGTALWEEVTQGLTAFSPTVWRDFVYLGTLYDHTLRAFDARTGALRWQFVGAGAMVSPVVAEGRLYAAANSGIIYALDPTTGVQQWQAQTGIGILATSPTVAGGMLYIGSSDHSLYALDAATGALVWTANIGEQTSSTPAVSGGVIYIGSDNHNLYAFDAFTGAPRWSAPTASNVGSSPAVANGLVYVGAGEYVYAFDAAVGKLRWRVTTGGTIAYASPIVANGIVYLGSGDDVFYAMDAMSGEVLWTYTTGGPFNGAAAVVDGVLYVGSFDGNLYAFAAPY